MSLSSSISVTVRVRPFSIREAAQLSKPDDAPAFFGDGSLAGNRVPKLSGKGVRTVVKVMDERMLVFDPPEENPLARYQKTILPQGKRVKDMRFGFDRVFDENCTQQDVYEATTRQLLDSVLDGFNATVFAYGATGCGKTHTISGNPQQPGIIFLTCAELFERIHALKDEKHVDLTLSYLEIYNETIRDLLVPGGSKLGLQLREDTNQNIAVAGLSTHTPKTVEEVMDIIVMGNANRTMSPTEANATSSRSHAVLQINVVQKPKTAGVQEDHFAATLSIIDLAGSERASVTKNRGERLLEGANINRSLLALGNCINALCDPSKKNHVPYRDSKLTRLLKFSLGGNCKTVMIVCVSPSSQHYDETHNTLKYANRAKNIKTKVSRNMINVNRHVSQYVKAIYDLRQEVATLKHRLSVATEEAMDKIKKQSLAKDTCIVEGLRRIRSSFEQSKELQNERINDLKNLRIVQRRASLISAWMSAFDEVFESRQYDKPPTMLFKMRKEAEKTFQEMEESKFFYEKRKEQSSWSQIIDTALANSVRSLKAIEGVKESDIQVLTCEAEMLTARGERDVLHALCEAEVDVSSSIHTLTKAHYETITTIHKIMATDISEAEAIETARRSLFDLQQGASDALSHIIKPGGELVSTETYQPSSFSPRKPRHSYAQSSFVLSPMRTQVASAVAAASPLRGSPKPHKVRTPKKTVKFGKKDPAKKRVRFQDDVDDSIDIDEIKRSRTAETNEALNSMPHASPPPQPNLGAPQQALHSILSSTSYIPSVAAATENSPPHGLVAPPVRTTSNRFQAGYLSKTKDSNSPPPADVPVPNASDSPLQAFDEQVMNRLKSDDSFDERPRATGLSKAAMRKSTAGVRAGPQFKRRSPSNSCQPSPENQSNFKVGHAKRLPSRGEKENSGSMTSVLSPKSAGIKTSARRTTVNGPGSVRLSSRALAALQTGTASVGRDSLAPDILEKPRR
ncbi:P-loop containing nucleoside triphosphate hydrolase protein [Geopyxis carbonaria]|nr:P-loop containing nucleoside triphosphate hydrolase protein [Geopyxis carbonaria]